MIPGWKAKREVLRLREQLAGIVGRWTGTRRTKAYDASRHRLVVRHPGSREAQAKMAALLIFQPGNLPDSILNTCDLLHAEGYSVLVVSNGHLPAASIQALAMVTWRVLERPNLGYDFGGYREAVMHLWDEKLDLEELVIMNDSVWVLPEMFPAFIKCLRSMKADVSGAVIRSKKGKSWIESYFYLLGHKAWSSAAFRNFWSSYRLIDSKYAVIRQGERDFSIALATGGLSLVALADNAGFLERMASATNADLRNAILYTEPTIESSRVARDTLLADTSTGWRKAALSYIASHLDDGRVWNSEFPCAGHAVLGYPFVKKSMEPINVRWRAQLLRALADSVIKEHGSVELSEIRERQTGKTRTAPHSLTPR